MRPAARRWTPQNCFSILKLFRGDSSWKVVFWIMVVFVHSLRPQFHVNVKAIPSCFTITCQITSANLEKIKLSPVHPLASPTSSLTQEHRPHWSRLCQYLQAIKVFNIYRQLMFSIFTGNTNLNNHSYQLEFLWMEFHFRGWLSTINSIQFEILQINGRLQL